MKIVLLVAPVEHGYSFLNQANGLLRGLSILKNEVSVIKAGEEDTNNNLKKYGPDVVISIGDWQDYPLLVNSPMQIGMHVIPWFVSDGSGENFINSYNSLSCIAVPSQHSKLLMVQKGVREELITVVHEAVDSEYWHPIASDELQSFLNLISPSQAGFGLPVSYDLNSLIDKDVPILFTTGGDATTKGAQEVISALAELDPKLPWVYIIKTWPSYNSFKYSIQELKLAEDLGIASRIRYISGEFSRDFIRGLMNACDIYVAPSRREGFGLPLVEAQLCGKPVISLAAHATAETILDNKTGFLIQAEETNGLTIANKADLKQSLLKLLTDKSLRKKMGANARNHAIKHFSPQPVAEQMIKLIKTTSVTL